jgi:hypothetical protein
MLWLPNLECSGSGHYGADGRRRQQHGREYHRIREGLHAGGRGGVELTGTAGTLIFWHHRLAHAAGANTGGSIRLALRADFRIADVDVRKVPGSSMWSDWGVAVQNAALASGPTHPVPVAPPSSYVRVSVKLSDSGPLAYYMDWQLVSLGQGEFEAATTTADDVRCYALALLPLVGVCPKAAARSTLRFEYPPRPWPTQAHAKEPEALAWLCDGPGGLSEPLPWATSGLGWLTLEKMRLGADLELVVQLPVGEPWPSKASGAVARL